MNSQLEKEVAQYQQWRDSMTAGIEAYKTWLDTHGYADIQQSLRIYDLIESLRNDRMTLAFLAEFSRGKTELINAMLFADFKQRLLPASVGRTTMCPTEIFHDAAEPPYIRLLPIETRGRQDSIAALKRAPVEWMKIGLDLEAPEEVVIAMRHLVETKTVTLDEARGLGLWDDRDPATTTVVIQPGDRIEIPAWRHAMISWPHPLLKSGLVILDTPGLNALGTEPELTLSMIPNAHAVLFLLAMDTGVTKSDLDVWQKYVQSAAKRRIAVLNKIDLMWDELKPEAEIAEGVARQIATTAGLLALPRHNVLAVSAQKALVARVKGDAALLERSGLLALESLLASEIIPAKQEILRVTVQREIGGMVDASRATVKNQLAAMETETAQLTSLSGKSRTLAQAMVVRLEGDHAQYQAATRTFQSTYNTIMGQGAKLLLQLNKAAIAKVLEKDREFIEGAWTTAGLWKSMQGLFDHFNEVSDGILQYAGQIQDWVGQAYGHFHEKFGFARIEPPQFDLERNAAKMAALRETARAFCHDPMNIMREKHFVISRFYEELVMQAGQVFEVTRIEVEQWLKSAFSPLNLQLKDHEQALAKRIENFKKIRDNIGSAEDRLKALAKQRAEVMAQAEILARIREDLKGDNEFSMDSRRTAPPP